VNLPEEGFECLCPPGSRLDPVISSCDLCPLGTFREDFGVEQECRSCDEVLESTLPLTDVTGATHPNFCSCPKGFVSQENRCRCALDTFGAPDSDQCTACPESRPVTVEIGAESIDECFADVGSLVLSDGSSISCLKERFSEKIVCDKRGVTTLNMELRPGHWRIARTSNDVRLCPVQSFCPGGAFQPSGTAAAGAEANELCAQHHEGILCLMCEEGFALDIEGGCQECTDSRRVRDRLIATITMSFIALLLVLPALVILHRGWQTGTHTLSYVNRLISASRNWRMTFGIFLGFFQVYSQALNTFNLIASWDASEVFVFTQIQFTEILYALRFGCSWAIDFYGELALYTLLPLSAVAFMWIAVLFLRAVRAVSLHQAAQIAAFLMLQLLYFIYPGVSSMVLRTFLVDSMPASEDDPNPFRALKADYTIDYDSKRSRGWRAYAGVMVIVYPILTVVLFVWGVRGYDRLIAVGKDQANLETPKDRLSKEVIFPGWRFLAEPFKTGRRWFEANELLRKFMMTSIIVIAAQANPNGSRILFVIFAFVFGFFLKSLRPYINPECQNFAEISLFLIMFLGVVALLPRLQIVENERVISGICITIAIVEVIAFFSVNYRMRRDESHADTLTTQS